MPQLQNNNVATPQFKQGNAPTTNSYINEVKVSKDYSIPENADYEKQMAINKIMDNISNRLQDFTYKAQQIDSENKFNDYQIERTRLTKQYELDYKKNPNELITKTYEKDLESLKNNYEKQVPSLFKNNFLNRIDQQNKQESIALEFFRKETDLNYQSTKFVNGLNNTLSNVSNASYQGNDEVIVNEVLNLSNRKTQLLELYGDLQGNEMYNDYTKRLLTGIIDGKLSSDRVKDVLNITKIIEMSPEFRDKLTPENIEQYKKLATDKKEKLEQSRRTKEEIEYFIKTNDVMKSIASGELNNYGDIVNRLIASGSDEYTAKLILKYAGYSTQLPPELLNSINDNNNNRTKSISDKELNRTKTHLEKQEYKSDLQNKIFALMTGKDVLNDKNLKSENTREVISNRIKEINQLMIEGLSSGYITESDYENFTNQLNPYLSQTLESTAKGNFNDKGGLLHFKLGYRDLNKVVNETLELHNFGDVDPKNLERKVGIMGKFLDKTLIEIKLKEN